VVSFAPTQSISDSNFGPLIAYLVPGATVLLGISQFVPAVHEWFAVAPADAPTISGFLYLTIAALAAGMIVSAVRWVVIDFIHSRTGLPMPPLDFAKLGQNVDAFALLIRIHYQYYQFAANMLVATAIAYVCYRVKVGSVLPVGWLDVGVVAVEVVFYVTSRDTLRKYYTRSQQLLGAPTTLAAPG